MRDRQSRPSSGTAVTGCEWLCGLAFILAIEHKGIDRDLVVDACAAMQGPASKSSVAIESSVLQLLQTTQKPAEKTLHGPANSPSSPVSALLRKPLASARPPSGSMQQRQGEPLLCGRANSPRSQYPLRPWPASFSSTLFYNRLHGIEHGSVTERGTITMSYIHMYIDKSTGVISAPCSSPICTRSRGNAQARMPGARASWGATMLKTQTPSFASIMRESEFPDCRCWPTSWQQGHIVFINHPSKDGGSSGELSSRSRVRLRKVSVDSTYWPTL